MSFDADLEYDPEDYPKLIEPIRKNIADIVYGSGFVGSDEKEFYFIGIVLSSTLSNMFTILITVWNVVTKLLKPKL